MAKKKRSRKKSGLTLEAKISKLPAHQRKAIDEWLDPMRFRRPGGK
jgi:hypothetical protein